MTKKQELKRNLNPHKAARVAMILYSDRYARQSKGSMGFWDTLTEGEKRTCRDLVESIEESPEEKL